MNAGINKKAVAQSFSRAAESYDRVAHLQMQVGEQLLASIEQPEKALRALDIGCGTGQLTRLLAMHARHITALDFALGMLQFARDHHRDVIAQFVCADADNLPFPANQFDLIFSNFVLQWCESLPCLMSSLFQLLQPGGVLAFSIPGERTLWELKQSWQQADPSHVHVNQFPSLEQAQTAVNNAGFETVSAQQQQQILYYNSVRLLTQELKTLGAHNVNEGRSTHLTGKRTVAQFVAAYEAQRTAQGLPASWDIIRVVARKPF